MNTINCVIEELQKEAYETRERMRERELTQGYLRAASDKGGEEQFKMKSLKNP